MAGQRNNYGKRSYQYSDHDNSSNSINKRRNTNEEKDAFVIDSRDTVYRFLCPVNRIGSIIGRGGDIVKQLRIDTKSKIRISDAVAGCEDRVITIYSTSEDSTNFNEEDGSICPAQDALFRVHDKVASSDVRNSEDDPEEPRQITAKLLVPSDQIGCIIGKGGQIVQTIRNDTGAQIRIIKDDNLPTCALSTDELVLISGDPLVVRKALYQIASNLRDNPSRTQHLLVSAVPNVYAPSGAFIGPGGAPILGIGPLMGPYGGYKGDVGDWTRPVFAARDDFISREFVLRLVCPTANIGAVIGKGGSVINQIRQDTGAVIKVDSSTNEGDDCLIIISAKEIFEDHHSPTMEAALRLQPRCSEKIERDSGLISFTTRLLVSSMQIGCLLGKGGNIINELRRVTKANIRILGRDNLPKVAEKDEEMVQISGDLEIAKDALNQIGRRLRANVFDREGAMSGFLPVLPYLPLSADSLDGYDGREGRRNSKGNSFSGGYASSDYSDSERYPRYAGSSQVGGGGYGGFSGRGGNSGISNQNGGGRRKGFY